MRLQYRGLLQSLTTRAIPLLFLVPPSFDIISAELTIGMIIEGGVFKPANLAAQFQ
ncbi:MAG: hypothetical protein Q8N00_17810 [Nitrospirota bacterium]|nr:hypothetical protein [Nitrospirota bacterium]MDP3598042.1 hypothetical protein [Nitrospirota bacterium]